MLIIWETYTNTKDHMTVGDNVLLGITIFVRLLDVKSKIRIQFTIPTATIDEWYFATAIETIRSSLDNLTLEQISSDVFDIFSCDISVQSTNNNSEESVPSTSWKVSRSATNAPIGEAHIWKRCKYKAIS